jgi:hypothetical protein
MSSIESATAIQQASIRTEISIAVAAKQLDAQQQQGAAAVELLETAAQLVKEAGKGTHIDSQA